MDLIKKAILPFCLLFATVSGLAQQRDTKTESVTIDSIYNRADIAAPKSASEPTSILLVPENDKIDSHSFLVDSNSVNTKSIDGRIYSEPFVNIWDENPIYGRFYVYQSFYKETHIMLGEYFIYNASVTCKPSERWELRGGMLFARQYSHFDPGYVNRFGWEASGSYRFSPDIAARFNISHFLPGDANQLNDVLLFPTSSIGGSLLFNSKSSHQIGIGVEQQNFNNGMYKTKTGGRVSLRF